VPPYFAYVLRAFSVLEGIALINDPDYSILNECLPYISQRVLTDESPRAAAALRSFVYGAGGRAPALAEGGDAKARTAVGAVVDAERLTKLAKGFSSFSAAGGGLSLDEEAKLRRLATELVALLLARQGSPLQDLLLDEAASLVDAQARGAFARARAATPEALISAIEPTGLLRAAEPLLTSYEEDEARLSAAEAISAPLLEQLREAGGIRSLLADEGAQATLPQLVTSELLRRREELPNLGVRFSSRLVTRAIDRIEAIEAEHRISENGDAQQLAAVSLAKASLSFLGLGVRSMSELVGSMSDGQSSGDHGRGNGSASNAQHAPDAQQAEPAKPRPISKTWQ
jgi:aarF domain-containing kinase